MNSEPSLDAFLTSIRACRICRDAPLGTALPHEPRPVVRVSSSARLLLAGQAPGLRVHSSGMPFTDPSGDRLRLWLGLDPPTFYDEALVAIIPMGFCFPGYNSKKADLPPRRECQATWHDTLFGLLPRIETVLAIGRHAQAYHFRRLGRAYDPTWSLAQIIRASIVDAGQRPRVIALPHPSWRNTGWLNANPWFEAEILPVVQAEVARLMR